MKPNSEKMKKILPIVSLLFVVINPALADENVTQKPSRFRIEKGSQFELCRDVKKILDEPENQNFGEPYITNSEFIIPKRYKDFRDPVWQDVSMEELPQYMASEEWLGRIKRYNEKYKDVPSKVLIQRTQVDLDHDGKKDDILRMDTDNMHHGVKGFVGNGWHCFVSDVVPSVMAKEHNEKDNQIAGNCRLVSYKGKIFKMESFGADMFFVFEPLTGIGIGFGFVDVCEINFTESAKKIAHKALERDFKKMSKTKSVPIN